MSPKQAVLKLVLDQGVPADAAKMFRELGYECLNVAEAGMSRADDEGILALLLNEVQWW